MAVDGARRRRSMRQATPTREGRLRTIDQTAHRGAARLISVHINELPSSRKASAHRRGPPRTARPKPPSAYSADGGFQLPAYPVAFYLAVAQVAVGFLLFHAVNLKPKNSGTIVVFHQSMVLLISVAIVVSLP
jgi:hypothetical protein